MSSFIDHTAIRASLERAGNTVPSAGRVDEILHQARVLKGLDSEAVLDLLHINDPVQLDALFASAKFAREEIYGRRMVLFAPLYVSNLCHNECLYCAFRRSNHQLTRKVLSQEELRDEVEALLDQGHKRVLLVAGEAYPKQGLQYVFDSIKTIYATRRGAANIRRINVNIAPLSVEEFRELYQHDIGTYQIFQETYHPELYQQLHTAGPKRDYQWRLEAMDRALTAGFKDVGVGILFGLADWRYEILALLQHIAHLEQNFGVGPHTISVPRLEPALGSDLSVNAPHAVSDVDFKKIIAVLRLAVPYTGIILSTRESARMRREAFDLGISQISAGSRTNPGGYRAEQDGVVTQGADEADSEARTLGHKSQFSLGDTRSMVTVIKEMFGDGYIPSFCTGCYRQGRVGKDFMDLAKPGLIKQYCLPNALLSFAEYLKDYGDDELRQNGTAMINALLQSPDLKAGVRRNTQDKLQAIDNGARDAFF